MMYTSCRHECIYVYQISLHKIFLPQIATYYPRYHFKAYYQIVALGK